MVDWKEMIPHTWGASKHSYLDSRTSLVNPNLEIYNKK